MSLHYIGPSHFRDVITRIYEGIADNYERDQSKLVVCLPRHLSDSNATLAHMLQSAGFDSQRNFNRYYDEKASEISRLTRESRKRVLQKHEKRRIDRIYDELFALSNPQGMKETGGIVKIAMYCTSDDYMVIDALSILEYMHAAKRPSDETITDIPKHVRHELVHYDLGECDPYVAIRKGYGNIIRFTDICAELNAASQEGEEVLAKLKQRSHVMRFIDDLGNPRTDSEIADAAIERLELMSSSYQRLYSDVDSLDIHPSNEALAFSLDSDREGYDLWLNNLGPQHDYQSCMSLFEVFVDMKGSIGWRQTLAAAKEAVNRSFSDGTNFFELFSV